jgi:enoyl-CoA hydratase/carnithine racemase
MEYKNLDWAVDRGILVLTLNRPERMNAFTVAMADELVDAFGRASGNDGIRAIVVTGAGTAFCAGMDLSVEGNVFGLDETQRWLTCTSGCTCRPSSAGFATPEDG